MSKPSLEIKGRHATDGISWRVTAHKYQDDEYSAVVMMRVKGSTIQDVAWDLFRMSLCVAEQLSKPDNELTTELLDPHNKEPTRITG